MVWSVAGRAPAINTLPRCNQCAAPLAALLLRGEPAIYLRQGATSSLNTDIECAASFEQADSNSQKHEKVEYARSLLNSKIIAVTRMVLTLEKTS